MTKLQMPGEFLRSTLVFLTLIAVAGVSILIVYCSTGNSLDLFIGGLFLSSILTPIAAFARRLPGACQPAAASIIAVGCGWLSSFSTHVISLQQWVLCTLLLAGFSAALSAVAILLTKLTRFAVLASGLTTAGGILWLTWPVWLSASLPGTQLHWSVAIHPLFAINKIVINLGIWTEQQGAYGLTTLGQDVQYQMPASPWPAILFHSFLAGAAIFIAWLIAPRSMNQIETDANAIKNK